MKSIIKKICLFVCMIAIGATAAACTNNAAEKVEENIEAGYSKELAKYFPNVEGTVLNYSGTAEYGHTMTLNKVIEEKEKITLNFKGIIQDMSEGEGAPEENRILETEYIIDKDSVKEIQKNETRRFSQSIIREQMVLKLPIQVGNTWTQKVNVDGKEYTAEIKITELATDEENKSIVTTEMTIKGIAFYPENTYKEVKTFKEGKGLIEFSNTILLNLDKEPVTPFEFHYSLFDTESRQ